MRRSDLLRMSPEYITKTTFRRQLSREEVMAVIKERMPAFLKLDGLIQKDCVDETFTFN